MYVDPQYQLTDREALFSLMASRPLGAWVCHGREGLIANHVPFFLDRSRGPLSTLIGHVSRANTVWHELGPATPSVVMLQGPQAYITPGWYPSKAEHGKVVPTWNYVVAHVHGVARAIKDRDWLLDMLNRLTDVQEAHRPVPWTVSDARSSTSSCAPSSASRYPSIDSKASSRPARTKPCRTLVTDSSKVRKRKALARAASVETVLSHSHLGQGKPEHVGLAALGACAVPLCCDPQIPDETIAWLLQYNQNCTRGWPMSAR